MSSMLKSSAGVALATLLSRLLGLVREMVYARFMGNGWVASSFLLAFQIPNLFRRLLGEGALTASFIPEFKTLEKTEGDAAMWQAANAVLSGLVIVASALSGLAILLVSLLLHFGQFAERTRLMMELLRIMFPYMILVCVAAVCMGMLNARGRFFVPALGAALLNVVMIASVLVLAPRFGSELPNQIYALAFGVLGAGLAQACFQFPSLALQGWHYRWVPPWSHPTVRQVIHRMLPTTLGVAAFQLNVMITQGFAFFLGETVVASFQYAVRLMELPQGFSEPRSPPTSSPPSRDWRRKSAMTTTEKRSSKDFRISPSSTSSPRLFSPPSPIRSSDSCSKADDFTPPPPTAWPRP